MDDDNWIRDPIEITARNGAAYLASQINWWIRQKGVQPAYTERELTHHIGYYLRVRNIGKIPSSTQCWYWYDRRAPEGWDGIKEWLWREWLDDTFTEEEWETAVLDPVFGTLTWDWEPRGWRLDIFSHLHAWVQQSEAIVALRDPRPPPPPPPVEEAEQPTVDPYLAEQEERKRKR